MADNSQSAESPRPESTTATATKDETHHHDGSQFFEGVEKLLEIWFGSSDGEDKQRDLRHIPRQKWESLLKIVRCEIISFCSNDMVDAYVLSESSMFVAKRRLILKTCGTTTPLQCLQALLQLVQSYTGFDKVEDLFYSRKSYQRPELQMAPHQGFEQEVHFLDGLFPDGEAFRLGARDHDCWYLYALQRGREREADQTLEVLMTQLDPEVMALFTRASCASAPEASRRSGIDQLIPGLIIDDFLFEPCGYSMNGLAADGTYMTIHVTPEPDFSYVSFESNVPSSGYGDLLERVLRAFRPGSFALTLFANRQSPAADLPRQLGRPNASTPGVPADFIRRDAHFCRFKHYDLACAFYSRFPS